MRKLRIAPHLLPLALREALLVAIRQLSTPEAVLAGGRRHIDAPEGAAPWVWAPDGAGLAKKLAEVGILRRYR